MKMKKVSSKILALVMACAMLFSISAPALAAGITHQHEDGDKTIHYVSLGDSMTNGYGLPGYELNSGVETYADVSYANQFADWLEETSGATVDHAQLAMSGIRVEDLHWLLELDYNDAEAIAVIAELIEREDEWESGSEECEALWNSTFTTGDFWTLSEICNHSRTDATYLAIVGGVNYDYPNKSFPGKLDSDWEYPTTYDSEANMAYSYNRAMKIAVIAKYFQEHVTDADIISLGVGNGNLGVFGFGRILDVIGFSSASVVGTAIYKVESAIRELDPATQEQILALKAMLMAKVNEIMPAGYGESEILSQLADIAVYIGLSMVLNYMGAYDAIVAMNPDVDLIQVAIMNTFAEEGETEGVSIGTIMDVVITPVNAFLAAYPTLKQLSGDESYANARFYYADAGLVDCMVNVYGDDFYVDGTPNPNSIVRNRFVESIVGGGSGTVWSLLKGVEFSGYSLVPVSFGEIMAYEAMNDDQKLAYAVSNTSKAVSICVYLAVEDAIISSKDASVAFDAILGLGSLDGSLFGGVFGSLGTNLEAGIANEYLRACEYVAGVVKATLKETVKGMLGIDIEIDVTAQNIFDIIYKNPENGVDGAQDIAGAATNAIVNKMIPMYRDGVKQTIAGGAVALFEGLTAQVSALGLSFNAVDYANGRDLVDVFYEDCAADTFGSVRLAEYISEVLGAAADTPVAADGTTLYQMVYYGAAAAMAGNIDTIKAAYPALKNDEYAYAATLAMINAELEKAGMGSDITAMIAGMVETNVLGNVGMIELAATLFALPEALSDALQSDETVAGLLGLMGRCMIGNGLGAHPSDTGHDALAAAVISAYETGYTAQDETIKNLAILGEFIEEYYDEAYEIAYNEALKAGVIDEINAYLDEVQNTVNDAEAWVAQYSEYLRSPEFAVKLAESFATSRVTIEEVRALINTADKLDAESYAQLLTLLEALTVNVKTIGELLTAGVVDADEYIDGVVAELTAQAEITIAELTAKAQAEISALMAEAKATIDALRAEAEAKITALIAETEAKIEALKAEAKAAIAALRAEAEATIADLIAKAEAKIAELQAEAQARLDFLYNQLNSSVGDAVNTILAEIERVKTELAEAIAAINAKLEADIAAIETALANAIAKVEAELAAAIAAAKAAYDAAIESLNAELRAAIAAVEAKVAAKIAEIEAKLAEAIAAVEAELRAAVETAKKNIETAIAEIKTQALTKIAALKAEAAAKIDALKAKVAAEIAALKAAAEAKIDALIAQIEAQIEALKAEAKAQIDALIAQAQAQIEALKAEAKAQTDALIAQIEALKAQAKAQIDALIAQAQAELELLNNQLMTAVGEAREAILAEIARVEAELEAAIAAINAKLAADIAALEAAINAINTKLAEDIAAIEAALEAAIVAINAKLAEDIAAIEAALEAAIATVKAELAAAIAKVEAEANAAIAEAQKTVSAALKALNGILATMNGATVDALRGIVNAIEGIVSEANANICGLVNALNKIFDLDFTITVDYTEIEALIKAIRKQIAEIVTGEIELTEDFFYLAIVDSGVTYVDLVAQALNLGADQYKKVTINEVTAADIARADLITVAYSGESAFDYAVSQALGAVSVYADTALRASLNAYIADAFTGILSTAGIAQISTALNGAIDGVLASYLAGARVDTLDWAGLVGEENLPYIYKLEAAISDAIIDAGIPATVSYTVDVVDLLYTYSDDLGMSDFVGLVEQDYLYSQLGENALYTVELPVAQVLNVAVSSALYEFISYNITYAKTMQTIVAVNPEATVSALGNYNRYDLDYEFFVDEVAFTLADVIGAFGYTAGAVMPNELTTALNALPTALLAEVTVAYGSDINAVINKVITLGGENVNVNDVFGLIAAISSLNPLYYAAEYDNVIYVDIAGAGVGGDEYIAAKILGSLIVKCEHTYSHCEDATCDICGDVRVPGEHSFTNYIYNGDATCTANGTKTATCDNGCGVTDTVEAEGTILAHTFTNYVSNGDATCTTDGTKTAMCDDGCGASDTVANIGSATGHSFTNYVSNGDATCTADGTKTAICDNGCGTEDTVTDEGSIKGHIFTNYVSNNNATCEKDGTKTATCDRGCGATNTVTDEGTATGHSFTNYVSNGDATCESYGTKTAICDNGCGKEDQVIDTDTTLGHNIVTDAAVDATCTEDGLTAGAHCSVCNTVFIPQEVVPAKGHTEVDVTGYAATCTEPGLTDGKKCTVCDIFTVEQTAIAAKGHDIVTDAAVDATCTEDGLTAGAHCSVCNTVFIPQEVVPAKGHNYTNYVSNGDATCTEDGTKTAICNYGCGETDTVTDTGSKKGHSYTNYVSNGDATCTEDGTKTATCDNGCGTEDTVADTGSALGHAYDNGVVTTAPTYTAEGVKTYTCGVCGNTYTEVVPMLEKADEIVSSDNGDIKVNVPAGSTAILNANTEIKVEAVTGAVSETVLSNITAAIGKGKTTVLASYDIALLLDGAAVQPGGKVAFTLPAPENTDGFDSFVVVYIDDNGNVTPCETTVNEDGSVTFLTDHFSQYSIVGVNNGSNAWIWISAIAAVLVAGAVVAFIVIKKKRNA